ncbi:MAG: glycosyltransferase family 1 protein [Bdellovibrionia bacterium]
MHHWSNCALIVFSHLRWDSVFQRPQHLMTRFAKTRPVFYIEEPIFNDGLPSLEVNTKQNGISVVVPSLPGKLSEEEKFIVQRELIDSFIEQYKIQDYALWYYTPMAIPFTQQLKPRAVIYDCMDELSMFHGAHPDILTHESQLFNLSDVVFTGGQSLYEYKKERHTNIHPFPSSIDFEHFHNARSQTLKVPEDQQNISGPKIGFYGVIDERMNLSLLNGIALERPNWQIILLGPTVKIDATALPRQPNIHYLGQKTYKQLPAYISEWDIAILPFAKNDSTRFISPTKTPEYLAAGIPVVSTSITDVAQPYGKEGLVYIADTVADFILSIESALELKTKDPTWCKRVDHFLSKTSWDKTWQAMADLMNAAITKNTIYVLEAT